MFTNIFAHFPEALSYFRQYAPITIQLFLRRTALTKDNFSADIYPRFHRLFTNFFEENHRNKKAAGKIDFSCLSYRQPLIIHGQTVGNRMCDLCKDLRNSAVSARPYLLHTSYSVLHCPSAELTVTPVFAKCKNKFCLPGDLIRFCIKSSTERKKSLKLVT